MAGECLTDFVRGRDTDEADEGARLVAEFLVLATKFLSS